MHTQCDGCFKVVTTGGAVGMVRCCRNRYMAIILQVLYVPVHSYKVKVGAARKNVTVLYNVSSNLLAIPVKTLDCC